MSQRKPKPKSERAVTDWAGLWFKFVEEVAGEFTGIRFGYRASPGAEIEWRYVPHTRFDGVGGFLHLLRERGLGQVRYPMLREQRPPSLWTRIWVLLRFMMRGIRKPAEWKSRDLAWAPSEDSRRPELRSVVTQIWDEQRTARMTQRARSHGVSLNSYLLWALDRALRAELGSGPSLWMLPVNMRGPVRLADDTSNHASYVQMDLEACAGPREVHEQVKLRLSRREHWATWLAVNVGRWVGEDAVRRMYTRDRELGRSWVGAFSNLGEWQEVGAGDWYFCPPVARPCPLGVGLVTYDRKLSLTLEAHPSITQGTQDRGVAPRLMDLWLTELEK